MPKSETSRQKNAQPLTAARLRIVLFIALILLLCAQVGVTFAGQNLLTTYSHQVAEAVTLSSSNDKTLQDLETAQARLNAQKDTVDKSSKLVAQKGSDYAYQSQIVEDLSRYANTAGIHISSYSFSDTSADKTNTARPSSTTGAAGTKSPFKQPAGVTPIGVTVTFAEGTSYDTTYKFLQLIEGNLLYMQPENITLGRSAPSDTAASSGISSLNLRIYKQS